MNRLVLCALVSGLLAGASHAAVVFDQPHSGSSTLFKSSWYSPDGLDGDAYCWDNFTVASNTAITEVHWRGGYEFHPSGSGQSPVYNFDVSIYRSIPTGTQPDLGTGGRLIHYMVGGNAGETPAGVFGGVQMYNYAFTLPSPFQAVGATPYWVQIEAWQGAVSPSFAPDWGLAAGTGGNNSHFSRITGGPTLAPAGDVAFSLYASGGPSVSISASEAPAGAGTIIGAGAYPVGSMVSLQAIANPGWGFVNWTEGATSVSTNANYNFTATVNRTLVAHFEAAYTITATSYPSFGGAVTGGGVYANGAPVTLVATPNHGFVFNSWSDGTTTAVYSFPAVSDLVLTAFFDSAPNAGTFDFDAGPVHVSLPLDLTANGLPAHFTGGYSIQPVGTLGISPAGMSGNYLYPSSVFQSDLGIQFAQIMKDFSVLYAVDELACDISARMRVTAYLNGVFAGTNTATAVPGTYPSATLSIAVPTGFNSVVVHWDAPGVLCQDYGPIFFADNVTVTRATTADPGSEPGRGLTRLSSPVPNPFRTITTIQFDLPHAADAQLSVYDVAGRLVRTLVRGSVPAGSRSITWDGTDGTGRRAVAGVYVVRLETPGVQQHRRLLLLK